VLLCDQPGQPDEVMGGAAEDEQPVYFVQAAQLHLAQRARLLQPAEALLDQPSPAQAEGIARVPCRPPVEARAPAVVGVKPTLLSPGAI